MQKGETVSRIMKEKREMGSNIVTFTATPVGISHLHDELIIEGNKTELRACGALLPCHCVSVDEPDLSKVRTDKIKTNGNGDFTVPFQRKYFWRHHIVGSVFDNWKKHNPFGLHTLGFAPGVPEAVQMAEHFHKKGVSAASIDANDVWVNGRRYKSERNAREDTLMRFKDGEIKVIWNRFVLREGIDLPQTYNLITACMIGSVASYVQVLGRLLRNHKSLDHVFWTDHGGNWTRFFSPNADLDEFWRTTWDLPTSAANSMAKDAATGADGSEPAMRCKHCGALQRQKSGVCYKCGEDISKIRCPKCKTEQEIPRSGFCEHCNTDIKNVRTRSFVQEDGTLVVKEDHLVKPKRIAMKPNTQQIWDRMYHRAKRSRNQMTFRQAEALFFVENYYYPPRSLNNMPSDPVDWFRKVKNVEWEKLQ